MAVPTIQSVTERRSFEINATSGAGTREFLVQFIAADQNAFEYSEKAFECRFAVDPVTGLFIPQEGVSLDVVQWPFIVVDSISPEILDEQNNLWLVTVEYLAVDLSPFQDKGIDPEDESWIFNWTSIPRQRLLEEDFSDPRKKVLNSAGMPFANLFVDDPLRRLILTRKDIVSNFDPLTSINFFGRINDVAVTIEDFIFPAETVRVDKWDAVLSEKEVVTGGASTIKEFYQTTIELTINTETWSTVLDTGTLQRFQAFDPAEDPPLVVANRIEPIRDEKGIILPGTHPLNGFGQRLILADGKPNVISTDGTFIDLAKSSTKGVFLNYKPHELKDLTSMRLNQQP